MRDLNWFHWEIASLREMQICDDSSWLSHQRCDSCFLHQHHHWNCCSQTSHTCHCLSQDSQCYNFRQRDTICEWDMKATLQAFENLLTSLNSSSFTNWWSDRTHECYCRSIYPEFLQSHARWLSIISVNDATDDFKSWFNLNEYEPVFS